MKTVALITDIKYPKLSPSDKLLVKPLSDAGLNAITVPWDKTNIDWSEFDLLIFRACWNYHQKIYEFNDWLTIIEELNIPTWNPLPLVRWNMHKSYLLDLQKRGISIIPTKILKQNSPYILATLFKTTGWNEAILKPAIGASSHEVYKITANNLQQYRLNNLLKKGDVLFQYFVPEISAAGEYSFIFFNKQFSFAVLKKPKPGDYRTHLKYGAHETLISPSPDLIEQATHVVQNINEPLLYTRVDGIVQNNKLVLMELELIEPQLFFDLYPPAAVQFTHVLKTLV